MRTPISMDTAWKGVPHRVPAQNQSRLLIEVEVDSCNGLSVAEQYVPGTPGPHQVVIYAGQLAEVKALVRTEEERVALANAKQAYENQIAEIKARLTDSDGTVNPEKFDYEVKNHPDNIYSILSVNPKFKAGLGPITALRVVEEVPAPPTIENLQAAGNASLADAIREAVASASGQRVPSKDELSEYIRAEVEKGVALALESMTKPKK